MIRLFLVLMLSMLAYEAPLWAQSTAIESGTPTKKAGRKAKARATKPPTDPQLDPSAPEILLGEASSAFFPDWGRPGFDWTLGPLVGFRYQSDEVGTKTVHSSSSELGLRGGLSHIPLIPGNPGLDLGLHGAQAWGVTTATVFDDANSSNKSVTFTRSVLGLRLTAYYAWLRQELSYTYGRIAYNDEADTLVQSTTIQHDLGVLVLSWVSAHHTYTLLRAYGDSYGKPYLIQDDHWLHARLFTSFLSLYFDFGPGWTYAREYGEDIASNAPYQKLAQGQTEDLRVLTGMHLFWKLGASGQATYVYHSSSQNLGNLSGLRLPAEELSELSSIVLPADSLRASLFAGLRDIFYGLSVGWRYNLEVLNMSSKGEKKRAERSSQGPVVGYVATF